MRALTGLLLLTLGLPALFALDLNQSLTQYAHRVWSQEEGLFQPTIYSIVQTRDGFLWLGTQDSLIRFDGVRFREFNDGASPLHGRLIRSLAQDNAGNLWVGSLGGGLARIDAKGDVHSYTQRDGLGSDYVFCVAEGEKGAIWACTNGGISRIASNTIRTYTTRDGLPSNQVRAACETRGQLWIAGLDFGLSRWNGSRFETVALPGVGPHQNATALACAQDGSAWVGTIRGLMHVSASGVERFANIGASPENEISSLLEGPNGALWIGTSDGINRLHNGEVTSYRSRDGLSNSQVLALWIDREGDLWAGTKNGLDQFADGKATPFTTNEGLSSNDVGPVASDTEGNIWIGTLDRGLNVFDGKHVRVIDQAQGLLSNRVVSLAIGRAGDVWAGTAAGVNRIAGGRVVAGYRGWSGEVRSLFVDPGGRVWASNGSTIARLAGNRFVAVKPAESNAPDPSRTVPLFAGSDRPGVFTLAGDRASFFALSITHPVDAISLDADGTLWAGTLGSGLLRLQGSALARIYARDGLYDTRIYSILRDDRRDFWLASSKGIFRLSEREVADFLDGKRKTLPNYPFTSGQLHFECRPGVEPAATRTRDGKLWFSTSNGLVVIDPDRASGNLVTPPAAITALVANGRRMTANTSLRLNARDANTIEIRYAGLSFINPEKVTFRYRLRGYEKDWVDAGVRREAFYTNLPPGSFAFEVEARNADGVWSASPAALTFFIAPRFYQRRWFFPVLALALGLSIFAAVRLRMRRMRTRFALVLAERTRIARELHDTLLQGLSGITMQLQALSIRLPIGEEKRWLGDIIQDAARAAAEARQSLWGLRGNTGSPNLAEKLAVLTRQMVDDRHISVAFSLAPVSLAGLPDCEFQLLRIAREALTNTRKHANALHLKVALEQGAGGLYMRIEDDGMGFAGSVDHPLHFGMRGMRERAAEIGAELHIESSLRNGTCVTVFLPLPEKLLNARVVADSNQNGVAEHQVS